MSFHPGQTFTFGETPSATKWNYLWENDYALQDWSAFTNDTFPIALIQDGDITAAKLDADAIGHGFLEIGRTTLGSTGTSVSVQNLPAFKYLKIIAYIIPTGGTLNVGIRFNNDSGGNYAERGSSNGAADALGTALNQINTKTAIDANPQLTTLEGLNIAAVEKLFIAESTIRGSSGAAAAPDRKLGVYKWVNTAAQISRVDAVDTGGTGDIAAGSEVVVFGKN